jgi:hypothetical protein
MPCSATYSTPVRQAAVSRQEACQAERERVGQIQMAKGIAPLGELDKVAALCD